MTPKEIVAQTVYRIINRATGEAVGSYSRAYHDEYDFKRASEAREANCNGVFQDKDQYAIAQYEVIYRLINADVDGENGQTIVPEERRCNICGGVVKFDGTPPKPGMWGGRG